MKKGCLIGAVLGVILVIVIGVMAYISMYNSVIRMDETVSQKLGDLQAQYQRRSDLIPNLVEVVKGYAAHEKDTLEAVVKARASATQVKLSADNPDTIRNFQAAQGELTQALSRLMVVVERYPDLKANQNFLDLQAQLEGTENRIKQARYDYNEAVRNFNQYVRSFIVSMIFGSRFPPKPYFEAQAGAEKAPEVKF